jgi:translation initiation factor 5B
MLELQRQEAAAQAVFPCILNTVAVFMKKDPIVLGVDVIEGSLRMGTPVATVKKNPVTGELEPVVLGRVTSIQLNHKAIPVAKKGSPSVAVKIEGPNQPLYGRHLDEKDVLYSHISRVTIDTLKKFYREEVSKEDWQLLINLKKVFNVT